jgi:DNA-binding transcriptional ArsR family regulator
MNPHTYSRDFKGVWIPKDIWLSRDLSLLEKVLFVEIHSLDNERGCFASNAHFANFFDIHPRRIAAHIASLRDKGYLTVVVTNHNDRVIRTDGKYARVPDMAVRDLQKQHPSLVDKFSRIEGMSPHPYLRDFKGVWIPKDIWLSRELSLMEKVLFVEIHSLDNERGCFASNAHFASFFDIHPRRIAAHIASLRDKGYITVVVTNHNDRVIRTAGKYARVSDAAVRELQEQHASLVDKFTIRRTGGMPKST